MRNGKGLLTASFHQPKALPVPRARVNFHLVVRLLHPAPRAAADGAQTHRLPPTSAPGSSSGPRHLLWPPTAPPAPGPAFGCHPHVTSHGPGAGLDQAGGGDPSPSPHPPPDWEGVKWRWLPSVSRQSAAMGPSVPPPHPPYDKNLQRKKWVLNAGEKSFKKIGFAPR